MIFLRKKMINPEYYHYLFLLTTPLLGAYLMLIAKRLSVFHVLCKKEQENAISYTKELPSISVVIYCHNHAAYLEKNLEAFLTQNYDNYEVIVVDDNSTDASVDILKSFSIKYPHLYHTFTPKTARYISRKKLSLTIGIKAAKNEWIFLTGADCRPNSSEWLAQMARNCTPNTELVLGYANYETSNKMLGFISQYDRLNKQIKNLGKVILGDLAIAGDGCNMGFRKSTYESNNGFQKNLIFKKGEDILFVNEVAKYGNARVELSKEAQILQENEVSLKSWITDNIYEVETNKHLSRKARLFHYFEATNTLISLFFYGFTIWEIVIATQEHNWLIVAIYSCIITLVPIINGIYFNQSGKHTDAPSGIIRIFLEPIRLFYHLVFYICWLFTKKETFWRR